MSLPLRGVVLLPQPLDDYLAAKGANGQPDFTPQQQLIARDLLASPHIIHERVVSGAYDRRDRFEDVNLEIVCIKMSGADCA